MAIALHAASRCKSTTSALNNNYLDLRWNAGINQIDSVELKVSNEAEYQQQARPKRLMMRGKKPVHWRKVSAKSLGEIWQINYNQPNGFASVDGFYGDGCKSRESNGYQDSSLIIRDRWM